MGSQCPPVWFPAQCYLSWNAASRIRCHTDGHHCGGGEDVTKYDEGKPRHLCKISSAGTSDLVRERLAVRKMPRLGQEVRGWAAATGS